MLVTSWLLDRIVEQKMTGKVKEIQVAYKGEATLFWPFYHLKPQFCGSTFHQITKRADAREIIHQCVPEFFWVIQFMMFERDVSLRLKTN